MLYSDHQQKIRPANTFGTHNRKYGQTELILDRNRFTGCYRYARELTDTVQYLPVVVRVTMKYFSSVHAKALAFILIFFWD